MAFSQNKTSTSNKLDKHKPSTYMVYLFGMGVKRWDGHRIIKIFKAIFKDQRCEHDFSTSQCQTEEIRTSLSCKGQGLNTHMWIETADGGAAVEEGKKKKISDLVTKRPWF